MSAGDVDIASLPLLQRVLLISDGTLTDIVEAAHQEPIRLVKLDVTAMPAAEDIPDLELPGGDFLMKRRVLLQGAKSGINYVYAETLIAVDRLHPEIRRQLLHTDNPIGRLWARHKLETRKEILRIWRVDQGEILEHFENPEGGLLGRSYRVFSGGQAIMVISEYFPAITK